MAIKFKDVENRLKRYEGVLGQLGASRDEAQQRATLTAEDLYGESITRATDNIRSNANNTKMVLGRASSASGGDVTGARGVRFDNIDQGANQATGNVVRQYSDRAEAANERSRNRADQLLNIILSGQGNLAQMENSLFEARKQRQLQKKQANKQLITDIIGAGANVGAALLSDKSLKKDITYVDDPEFEEKTGVKKARWIWKESGEPGEGVIAEDLQKVHPELVQENEAGLLEVDYEGLDRLVVGRGSSERSGGVEFRM